jgi:hypothetical protein
MLLLGKTAIISINDTTRLSLKGGGGGGGEEEEEEEEEEEGGGQGGEGKE